MQLNLSYTALLLQWTSSGDVDKEAVGEPEEEEGTGGTEWGRIRKERIIGRGDGDPEKSKEMMMPLLAF